jgi:hypothetical protein
MQKVIGRLNLATTTGALQSLEARGKAAEFDVRI